MADCIARRATRLAVWRVAPVRKAPGRVYRTCNQRRCLAGDSKSKCDEPPMRAPCAAVGKECGEGAGWIARRATRLAVWRGRRKGAKRA